MIDFIELVKKALEERGKTLENLFRDEIVSKNTFYKYRQRQPSLNTLIKIANYLEMSIDYLLERADENGFSGPYQYNKELFYNNLISLISARGLSNRQFCKNLNYSRDNVLRWKKGITPSITNLLEIANYFDCTLEDLLF